MESLSRGANEVRWRHHTPVLRNRRCTPRGRCGDLARSAKRHPGRAPEPCRRLAGDRDSRPVTMAGESRGGGRGPGGASLAPDRPAEDGQAVW